MGKSLLLRGGKIKFESNHVFQVPKEMFDREKIFFLILFFIFYGIVD